MTQDPATQGLQVYIVGGAVRDALLGLPAGDQDWVVVGATPEDMARRGFMPVGGDFPVFLHPRTKRNTRSPAPSASPATATRASPSIPAST